jgi:hypothetical protein
VIEAFKTAQRERLELCAAAALAEPEARQPKHVTPSLPWTKTRQGIVAEQSGTATNKRCCGFVDPGVVHAYPFARRVDRRRYRRFGLVAARGSARNGGESG